MPKRKAKLTQEDLRQLAQFTKQLKEERKAHVTQLRTDSRSKSREIVAEYKKCNAEAAKGSNSRKEVAKSKLLCRIEAKK